MRVNELEDENNCLRAALNLPPANRPPLGKGPTGKDKPKSLDNQPSSQSAMGKSRDSSPIAESPSPRRSQSESPSLIGPSMRTPPIIESNWHDDFVPQPPSHPPHISSTTSVGYSMRPPTTTLPQKAPHQFAFSAQSSRPVMTGSVAPMPSGYSHSTDRPLNSGYNDMNYLLCDVRDSSHYSYPYPQSPFVGESSLPTQPPQVAVHSQPSPTTQRPSVSHAPAFQPRRPHNEPASFRPFAGDLHLPSPTSHHTGRMASPPSPSLHDVRTHYVPHGKQVNLLP